jgi:hypothetical protein
MEFSRTWPEATLSASFLPDDEFGQFLCQKHMKKSLIYDIRCKEKVVPTNLLPLGEGILLKEREDIIAERGKEKKNSFQRRRHRRATCLTLRRTHKPTSVGFSTLRSMMLYVNVVGFTN